MNDYIVVYKSNGKFCNVYDSDAIILNYLFNYRVLNNSKCGFPINALDKVINKFEELKISYQILGLDKSIVKKNFRKLNNYNKYLHLAKENMDITAKLDIIIDKIKNCNKEQLNMIIEAIDTCID